MKKEITCPCGGKISFDYEEEIDIDQNAEYLDKILNGTFMSCICLSCKKKHKPEFKIMISWKTKNLLLEVLPELERMEFYRRKIKKTAFETVIGFPEMADRISVIKDDLEPAVIEKLKLYLLVKAEENYPDKEVNAWYHCKSEAGIEFHLDGIREGEVAVMKIPQEVYEKTKEDYKKHPKKEDYAALRVSSYLSVQNMMRPDI
jgi:hypothetical protein